MKPESLRVLRKEILRAYEAPLSTQASASFPWRVLRCMTRDCVSISDQLREQLTSCCDREDAGAYFELQTFNDPQSFGSASEFLDATSLLSFLKKYPFGKVALLDPLLQAEKRFHRAEKLCRISNRRIKHFEKFPYRLSKKRPAFHSVFHAARHLIRDMLGPLDLNLIHDHARHGPGGAVGVTGSRTTAYYKFSAPSYTVTTRALPLAQAAVLADPLWRRYVASDSLIGDPVPSVEDSWNRVLYRFEVVNYNKVTFVPKTAQTHRAIAIEPLMNIFLQLGVGDLLSNRLKTFGLNLFSQERNQNLARLGSCWNGRWQDCPVTLDLSMASDTLCIELVKALLPEEWFDHLSDIRSPIGVYGSEVIHWAKFSSMGNGFTFPLESMIFYALSLASCRHFGYDKSSLAVYGDDIICPRGVALFLVEVLKYSGFSLNDSKSYILGPFRESCGTDWFLGTDVRPFFLKRELKNARDLIFLLNSLLSSDCHYFGYSGSGDTWGSACRFIVGRLPQVIKKVLLGPRSEDKEGHIHVPWDVGQKSPLTLWSRDCQCWTYASVRSVAKEYDGCLPPIYLQLMWDSFGCVDNVERGRTPLRLLALEFKEVVAPCNKSVVTRRMSTRLSLAMLFSNGWHND